MDDLTALALRDRVCDATDRIPTAAWPFFSQTISGEIVAGATTGTFTFEAERDTLLTDLSITVQDDADAALQADLDIEYCNDLFGRRARKQEAPFPDYARSRRTRRQRERSHHGDRIPGSRLLPVKEALPCGVSRSFSA
jgi:hypothetical protein